MSSLAETVQALVEMGPEGIARFQESLEPEWISEALEATGTASLRRRKLPAEQAVWLVLGMGLFADRAIVDVVDHLGLVLPGVDSLAKSAVPQARYRLGAEPMKWLFKKVAEAWSDSPRLPGWRGLDLYGVDGTCARVQDSDENFEFFGKPGGRNGANDAGYPQLRLAALMNLRSRLLIDAAFGPYAVGEHSLAASLWGQVGDHSLTIIDKGFTSYALFADLVLGGTERHFLIRMKSNLRYEEVETLPDGTILASIQPCRQAKKARPDLPDDLRVRIIHYQHEGGEPQRLMTSLLDPELYPADEIIALYHERWETELGYDELKTHMIERKECLRSKKPEGVIQEVWGLLLVYNLVRREMLLAADAHGLPPRRISFRSSLLWIRNIWLTAWLTRPGNLPRHLGELRSTLDVLILPDRRTERRYPRHVKIKMSKYPRNRGCRAQKAKERKPSVAG
jgi:hypothetical protein